MSDYESHTGKIRLLQPNENETFEEQCKRLWVEESKLDEEFDDSEYTEGALFDDYYKRFLKINGKVWEIFDHKEMGDEDDMFCKLHDNKDGTFSFHTRFYNGGTYLGEMLSDEIEKL